jgi:hypothetical protein
VATTPPTTAYTSPVTVAPTPPTTRATITKTGASHP